MIPKKLHYIWLGGKKKTNLSQICINSWDKELSDFQITEWNETNLNLDEIASTNRFFRECRKRKLWAYMADYLRLLILYQEGGVYFDADIQVLKDFAPLLESECFLGMEAKGYIGTGVIASEPGHPLIRKCLEFYEEEIWNSELFTIPSIMTKVVKNNPELNNSYKIYPVDYFAPYDPWEEYRKECVTENTYCIHWFQADWIDDPAIRRFLAVKHINNPLKKAYMVLKKEIGAFFRKMNLR